MVSGAVEAVERPENTAASVLSPRDSASRLSSAPPHPFPHAPHSPPHPLASLTQCCRIDDARPRCFLVASKALEFVRCTPGQRGRSNVGTSLITYRNVRTLNTGHLSTGAAGQRGIGETHTADMRDLAPVLLLALLLAYW